MQDCVPPYRLSETDTVKDKPNVRLAARHALALKKTIGPALAFTGTHYSSNLLRLQPCGRLFLPISKILRPVSHGVFLAPRFFLRENDTTLWMFLVKECHPP